MMPALPSPGHDAPGVSPVLVEACVDSVDVAVACVAAGARRLELCGPGDGGTTPSLGLMHAVRARCTVPIIAMIRPRAGDFVMSAAEVDVMRRDIEAARNAGMDGVALGILRRDGPLDDEAMRSCVEAAGALPVTMHRAFDQLADPHAALDALHALGVVRVLTAGAARTALEGREALAGYVRHAAGRVAILPGGSVRAPTVHALLATVPVREVHARGTEPAEIAALVAALGPGTPRAAG